MHQYELPAMGISYGDKNAAAGKRTRRTSGAGWWVSMKVQAYSYGRETYSFRGYFSKGTCQMINDTLTGREGVKMDAMRVFRQTKRPSLIGGGLSWLNIRLGARISCHKHYSTGKEGTHTPKDHTATPVTGTAWREGSPIPFSLIPFRLGSPAGTRTGARPAGG